MYNTVDIYMSLVIFIFLLLLQKGPLITQLGVSIIYDFFVL